MLEVLIELGVCLEHQQVAGSKHLALVQSCATAERGKLSHARFPTKICQVNYESQHAINTSNFTSLAFKLNGFPA